MLIGDGRATDNRDEGEETGAFDGSDWAAGRTGPRRYTRTAGGHPLPLGALGLPPRRPRPIFE
jgi:hypothetical protein